MNTSIKGVFVIRSDPFFACFPGGGAKYGAHFDGGGINPTCRLTTMVYTNTGWEERHGGYLQLLDEKRRCWHVVPPTLLATETSELTMRNCVSVSHYAIGCVAFVTICKRVCVCVFRILKSLSS